MGTSAADVARDAVQRTGLSDLPLAVHFWDGSELRGEGGQTVATLRLRDRRALAYLVRAPNQIGVARAWVTGALELDGEFEALLALRKRIDRLGLTALDRGRLAVAALRLAGRGALRSIPLPGSEADQRGRRHSLTRDRQAIRHHYDVSNRFYELVLGPTMTYSAAYFDSAEDSLQAAQERKLELICSKLRLAPGERLLDIGCGWGSLLLHAARHHGARGVGVTLSGAQAEFARARVREARCSDRIEIRVADYRRLTDGPFDKIASVGMYEHVGLSQYDAYCGAVRSLLAPGGLFLNDGIARLFSSPSRRPTFIKRYVFPDGELHPLAALVRSVERAGLEPRGIQSTREHYARTLRLWLANLHEHWPEAEREVGGERVRVWELYMLASALAFEDGEITNYQLLAERPN